MIRFKLLSQVSILLLFIESIIAQIYNCNYNTTLQIIPGYNANEVCFVLNVNLTSDRKNFQLESNKENVAEVKMVEFRESQMQIMTRDVCAAIPHIEFFSAQQLGLMGIDEDAFEKCSKLRIIDLQFNNLTNLPPGLFETNEELSKVNVEHNQIFKVDEGLFKKNVKLREVFFGYNQLYELPFNLTNNVVGLEILDLTSNFFDELPILSRRRYLQQIDLSYNQLFDVEAEELLKIFPELRTLNITGNFLLCTRLEEIEALNLTSVTIETGYCIEDEMSWNTQKTQKEKEKRDKMIKQRKPKIIAVDQMDLGLDITDIQPRSSFQSQENLSDTKPGFITSFSKLFYIILGGVVAVFIIVLSVVVACKCSNKAPKALESDPEKPSEAIQEPKVTEPVRNTSLVSFNDSFSDVEEVLYSSKFDNNRENISLAETTFDKWDKDLIKEDPIYDNITDV